MRCNESTLLVIYEQRRRHFRTVRYTKMKQSPQEQGVFRKYLLHELAEAEQEEVEERLMTDREFNRRLAMAQDDLIDDFVIGALSEHEAESFRKHFVTTPARLQKLKFAVALDAYVTGEAETEVGAGVFEKVLTFLRARPLKAAASLAGAVFILGAALFILFRPGGFQFGRGYDPRQELAQVNGGREADAVPLSELRPGSASTPVLRLSQNLVRGDAAPSTVEVTKDVTLVRLLLEVTSGSYERFRAVLQTADGNEIAPVENLRAGSEDGAQFVVVNVPPGVLRRGDFRLRLFGIGGDGQAVDLGLYQFRVTTR